VGYLGEVVNWHYGFTLAGFGMIVGQIVYIWGQRHLKDVGNYIPIVRDEVTRKKQPFTKIEKDRLIVIFLSFIIVMVFWGAYEQAGGLMNLYAKEKIDRMVGGFMIPTSFLQALHAFYVILIGGAMAWFWNKWRKKGFESSSPFKMAIGTIVMGFGFLILMGASFDAMESADGKAAVWWMFASYLLHVVGELSISPVALSFITKLAPAKIVSFMMGAYFCVTGFANKLAGLLGEAAQTAGELAIFTGIAVFCFVFGLILLVFVKKLKALSHGAEAVTV